MRATLLLIAVSSLLVSGTEGWWGEVTDAINTATKAVVDTVKTVVTPVQGVLPYVPGFGWRGKRAARDSPTPEQINILEKTCDDLVDSGQIGPNSDPADFLPYVAAECKGESECVGLSMKFITECIRSAREGAAA